MRVQRPATQPPSTSSQKPASSDDSAPHPSTYNLLQPSQELFSLPLDITYRIFTYLDPVDIVRIRRVTKHWCDFVTNPDYMGKFLCQVCPEEPDGQKWKRETGEKHSGLPWVMENPQTLLEGAAHREHKLKMGTPVRVITHYIQTDSNWDWDADCGHIAWLTMEGHVAVTELGSQEPKIISLETAPNPEVTLFHSLVEGARVRSNVQIGHDMLVVTLNLYDGSTDDVYGTGRPVILLIYDLHTLRQILVHYIAGAHHLLGEVDILPHRICYIRKDLPTEEHPVTTATCTTLDFRTSSIHELPLPHPTELLSGTSYFLTLQHPTTPVILTISEAPSSPPLYTPGPGNDELIIRLYSLPHGELLYEANFTHSQDANIRKGWRHVFSMDFSLHHSRSSRFNILQSFLSHLTLPGPEMVPTPESDPDNFADNIRRLAGLHAAISHAPTGLPSIPFNGWSITPPRKGKATRIRHTRYVAKPDEGDLWVNRRQRGYWNNAPDGREPMPDRMWRRWEALTGYEHTSLIAVKRNTDRFALSVCQYSEADHLTAELYSGDADELRSKMAGWVREPERVPDYNYNWAAEQAAAIAAAQEPEEEDEEELEDELEQDEDDEAEAEVFLNMADDATGTLDLIPDDIASNASTDSNASSTDNSVRGPEVELHLGKNRPVYAPRPPHTEEEKLAMPRELGRYKRPDVVMAQKDRRKMRVTEKTRQVFCGGWRGIERPYVIGQDGELVFKGDVGLAFLHAVRFAEGLVMVKTKWREEREDGTEGRELEAVVVLDFNRPKE